MLIASLTVLTFIEIWSKCFSLQDCTKQLLCPRPRGTVREIINSSLGKKGDLGKGRPFFTLAHGVLNFMTFYVDRCDRNGHITSKIFHYYAML